MVEGGAADTILAILLVLSLFFNILLFYVSTELRQELRELKYGTRISREELEAIKRRLGRLK